MHGRLEYRLSVDVVDHKKSQCINIGPFVAHKVVDQAIVRILRVIR